MGNPREGGAGATWERDVKIIFCDLCLKNINLGNRPTTYFNKEGWNNLTKKFMEKTGREYNKTQLKNKWYQLKKDWKLRKELKHGSTDLGWDPTKKMIDTSYDWWREKRLILSNVKKFRHCGLDPEIEKKLDFMFNGVVATGAHSWTPNQEADDIAQEQNYSEQSHASRSPALAPRDQKRKKRGAGFLRHQISELVSACTSRANKVA